MDGDAAPFLCALQRPQRGTLLIGGVGVVDGFTNTFSTYIDTGFGLVRGDVNFLAATLIAIDITLAGLFWAWGGEDDIVQRLVKKVLFVGLFAFIIGNFNNLAKIIFNSFAGLGLEAAGSTVSAADFVHPGKIAQVGIDAGKPILTATGQLMGFTGFFDNFVLIFVLLISWLVVLLSFFVIAIQLFVTLIEFKLTTLAGFVLVPFGLFNKTAFLAEKVLGNVVASGIKVLVLAVIVGIGTTLFSVFTTAFPATPNIEDALSIMLAALTLLGLSLFGPGIATGLVSGAPQLGAGAVIGTGVVVGGLALAGGGAAVGAVGAASRFVGPGIRGGAALGTAAATSSDGGAAAASDAAAAGSGSPAAAAGPSVAPSGVADNLKSSFGASEVSASEANAAVREAATESGADAAEPGWAARLRQGHTVHDGLSAASKAAGNAERGGGGTSPNLSEET